MENELGANPPAQTVKERNARRNPEYARLSYRIYDLQRYLDGRRPIPRGKDEAAVRTELREALAARRCVPSCTPRRVVYYTRFADDFLVVLCNTSKQEAQNAKERIAEWLQEALGLTLNRDKTFITHWQKPLRFLGYRLQGRSTRKGTRWLHLSVPRDAIRDVVARVKQATAYPQAPEYDIFVNVNAIARGWTNYYRFAHDSSKIAGRLANIVFWQTAHYLGKHHRQSLRKIMRRQYDRDPRTGCKALFVRRPDNKTPYFLWHQRPKRLSVYAYEAKTAGNAKPLLNTSWATGHSMTRRIEAKVATQDTCQGCGRNDVPLFLHHTKRLRNAKRVQKGYGHVARSGYEQQGRLLCQACHLEHHHGRTSQ